MIKVRSRQFSEHNRPWWRRAPPARVLRVALLPALVMVLLGVLFFLGNSALRTQQEAMRAVVETDLETSASLAKINSRLQTANADMYRLMTQAAAGDTGIDYGARIEELANRVDQVTNDLKAYRDRDLAITKAGTLDQFIDDLVTYKGAIDWVGSMLDIDFKTSVAFIRPFNAHVDALSREITSIIADNTSNAKARAALASDALRRVAYTYVFAAALVGIMVVVFAYVTGQRQERLYTAAKTKTRQVETLLNNSGQGFLSFGPDLVVAGEYSLACETMLGRSPAGCPADSLLFPDPTAHGDRELLRTVVNRAMAQSDTSMRGIILSLLPGEISVDGKILAVEYKPLADGSIMLVLTDVTLARSLARQVERERRRLEMIVAAVSDGRDFFDAVDEFRALFGGTLDHLLGSGAAPRELLAEIYRHVHTFKGIFNQFSFYHLPSRLHEVEGRLAAMRDRSEPPAPPEIGNILDQSGCLDDLEADLKSVRTELGEEFLERQGTVTVSLVELKGLERLAKDLATTGLPVAGELRDRLARLSKVSLKGSLATLDAVARRVAERCEKAVAPLSIEGDDVLVAPDIYQPVLRTLGHVIRNAVDHGIEPPDQRLAAGKDEEGHISCVVTEQPEAIMLEIADDGAGIDRAALEVRAAERGLRSTEDTLLDLIFADGLSTRSDVSAVSGRGVGLAAVRSAVQSLGGTIRVISDPGAGSRFIFTLPKRDTSSVEAA